MAEGDIHYRTQALRKNEHRIRTLDNVSEDNQQILEEFMDYLFNQDLSDSRISRYLYGWYVLSDHIDFDLENPDKKKLTRLVGKINRNKIKEKDLADQTLREYKKSIRKFYTDFMEYKHPDFDGEELCDFFTLTVQPSYVDADRLPGPEEVAELVKNADRTRDKALIMTLWSSAGRISEVLGLKWKDVNFKEDIVSVTFRETKTGGNRTVPLAAGYLYLKELHEQDRRSNEPEAFVFRGLKTDKQLTHASACNIIKRASKEIVGKTDTGKAKYERVIPDRIKINPHAFRKGRATYLASQGMNQAQLCSFGGWVQGSREVAVYVRMAKEDVENGIRKVADMETKDDQDKRDLHPVPCPACEQLNKFEVENCSSCGETLRMSDLWEKVKVKETKEELKTRMIEEEVGIEDDEVEEMAREMIEEKIKQ